MQKYLLILLALVIHSLPVKAKEQLCLETLACQKNGNQLGKQGCYPLGDPDKVLDSFAAQVCAKKSECSDGNCQACRYYRNWNQRPVCIPVAGIGPEVPPAALKHPKNFRLQK